MSINLRKNAATGSTGTGIANHFVRDCALYALIATLIVSGLSLSGRSDGSGIVNSDDIMRLVTVRDLAGGQNWFDPVQYRLGLEDGTVMHWSRLVDAPLWLIYSTARLLGAGSGFAWQISLLIWPLLTLFLAVFAVNIACVRMGRPEMRVPATIIGAVSFMASGIFAPGAIDHHNIQVALCVLLVAVLVPGRHERAGHTIAGIVCVLMLAIGVETLPYVTIAGLWIAAAFVAGMIGARSAFAFGASLGLSSIAVFIATIAPANYGAVYCDSYSVFHIVMCGAGGFGLAASAYFAHHTGSRIIVLALAGVIAAAALLMAFPECLNNPLATLDPKLKTFWLDGVIETRSARDLWQTDPYQLFGIFGLAIMGVLASVRILLKSDKAGTRHFAALSLVLLATAIAVTVWQQRGTMFASALAVLPLSFVLTNLRVEYQRTNAPLSFLKMAGMGILSLNMFWWVAGAQAANLLSGQPTLQQQAANASTHDYCYSDDVFAPVADEPEGVVLGATDIGAKLLKLTPHRVLAGPYHRNTQGNLRMIEIMLAPPEEARRMLRQTSVTLIADCIKSADAYDFKKAEPDGLQAKLHRGDVPDWLEIIPETKDTPLVVYRFKP